jgi:hypothetical protein
MVIHLAFQGTLDAVLVSVLCHASNQISLPSQELTVEMKSTLSGEHRCVDAHGFIAVSPSAALPGRAFCSTEFVTPAEGQDEAS